jgi:hypothetical protein
MTASHHRVDHRDQIPARFTAAEFIELVQHPPIVDWPGKIELAEGEIVRMAPANVRHWNMQRITFLRLQSALAAAGMDWIVGQEPTVRLAADTIREPDVAVLRDPDLTATLFDGSALFLAIEVADTSLAIDLGRKRRDYAEALVPHYWVVDLNGRCIHVMADPVDDDYTTRSLVRFDEPLAVPDTVQTIVIG